ncbi:hypothetical protein B0J15DRAFT_549853 [Fusarium solani]|uniref:Uncharacterized protein n=1 Tax=Fusarium solani TaxID=169388 RepID=A0A9P9K893_FUSSL|nr:uncharacterized protein B0J15DRAFT_549853 [Fusarium solani]KAH7253122.1 hypothetical protein B0J15DRAFT_549853 [Fusarium solani]
MSLEFLNRLPLACNTSADQMNWTWEEFNRSRHFPDFGTCVFSCLTEESFWIIGVIIIIDAIFCGGQLGCLMRSRQESLTNTANSTLSTSNSDHQRKPQAPCWMQRHLKSRPWIALAIKICFLMNILVFYQGGAVLVTAWRLSIFYLQMTFPVWEPRVLSFLVYTPMLIIMLLGWAFVLCAGYSLVKIQIGLIKELVHLYQENPKKTVKNDDVELGDLVDEEDDTCPPIYDGWQQAELRVL